MCRGLTLLNQRNSFLKSVIRKMLANLKLNRISWELVKTDLFLQNRTSAPILWALCHIHWLLFPLNRDFGAIIHHKKAEACRRRNAKCFLQGLGFKPATSGSRLPPSSPLCSSTSSFTTDKSTPSPFNDGTQPLGSIFHLCVCVHGCVYWCLCTYLCVEVLVCDPVST